MMRWSIALILGFGLLGLSRAQDPKNDPPKPNDPPKEAPKVDPYQLPDPNAKEWKKQEDGLEIWDVKEGTGDAVKKSETVIVHYTGWLLDGKVFDSSRMHDKVATFPLDNLIKGCQVGIPGMKPGGVRRLKIPYKLAYGEAGTKTVPAKSTLIYEIELFADPSKMPDLKHKDWRKLDNGIRIWDIKVGDGEVVKPGATVNIHYTGWNLQGVVFTSPQYMRPFGTHTFTLDGTSSFKGWQVTVPGMKVGGIRRMELPPEFAFGSKSSPPSISANSTVVFEIDVKSMK